MRFVLILLILALGGLSWYLLTPGPLDRGERVELFALPNVQGRLFDAERHAGKVLCIIFFSVDDEDSRQFFQLSPFLIKTYQTQRNLKFIAVAVDGTAERVKLFLSEFDFSGDVLLDNENSLSRRFRLRRFPAFYLIDGEMTVIQRWIGWHRDHIREIRNTLKELEL